jgi:hypothetical protein
LLVQALPSRGARIVRSGGYTVGLVALQHDGRDVPWNAIRAINLAEVVVNRLLNSETCMRVAVPAFGAGVGASSDAFWKSRIVHCEHAEPKHDASRPAVARTRGDHGSSRPIATCLQPAARLKNAFAARSQATP